jgi:hypothetical protein
LWISRVKSSFLARNKHSWSLIHFGFFTKDVLFLDTWTKLQKTIWDVINENPLRTHGSVYFRA